MELDDFKSAWKALDQRLERDSAIQMQLLRDRRLDRARTSLRPLYIGQILQMFWGLAFIVLAAALWSTRPDGAAVIVAGVVVHAYGVVSVITASLVLGGISRIDYAAPVLEIQMRLARVRRAYLISGMVAGLPWWFLWVPLLMVLLGLIGVDLYARSPATVWSGVAIGAIGIVVTAWFHRWSRHPSRPLLARAMDEVVTGSSLRKAQAQLDELQRFERE